MLDNSINNSYLRHSKSYQEIDQEKELSLYLNWFNNGTVDIWRHLRSLDNLLPILKFYKKSKWITIGDGHFGTAATYINNNGGIAFPLDIDDTLLKIAKEKAMITDYCHGNAESIPYKEDTFDFAHCKETFHHFPRPYIALYEMIRVSRIGVVLSEPTDWLPLPIPRKILQIIKHFVFYRIRGKEIPNPDEGNYEPTGNYVFGISEREIIRTCTALNLYSVAIKRYHDVYIAGVEKELLSENGWRFKKIKKKILQNKILNYLGLSHPNRIIVLIFKEKIEKDMIRSIKKIGFHHIKLAKCPY